MRLGLWYGLAIGALGMLPFVAPVFERAGFSDAKITAFLLAVPIGSLLFGPLGASFADRSRRHHLFLRAALFIEALLVIGMLFAPAWGVAVCFVLFGAVRAPVFPVVDAATLQHLGSRYGTVRAVGSAVYAAVVLAAGALRGTYPDTPLILGVLLLFGASALVDWVPELPHQDHPVSGLLLHLRKPAVLILLSVALLNGLSLAIYDYLFTLYMDERGVGPWISAGAVAWGVLVEVGVLLAGRWLLERFEVRTLMLIGTGVGVPRFLGTAWLDDPVAIAALQGLHGIQFGCFWIAGLDWMSRMAPPDLRRSAQAAFSATGFGLAPILALGFGSIWLVSVDLQQLFGVLAIPAVAATLVAAWIPRAPMR